MQFSFLLTNVHIFKPAYARTLLTLINEMMRNKSEDYGEIMAFFTKLIDDLRTSKFWGNRDIKYYVIEGNIGSGKSTLLDKISGSTNAVIVPEPLRFWQGVLAFADDGTVDPNAPNLFEQFYNSLKEERTNIVVLFQLVALFSRLVYLVEYVEQNPSKSVFVSERSFLSDRFRFL